MLVLSRRNGESIVIGNGIVVTVLAVKGKTVRLGINAPPEVVVHRQEVQERIMSSQRRSEVEDAADTLLRDKSRGSFRDVSCQCEDEGTVILRGHSTSYYEKQVAQETLRGMDGVMQVVNEIEVTASGNLPLCLKQTP